MRKSRKYPDTKEQLARAVKSLRQRGYSEDTVLQLVLEAYRAPPPEKPWGLHPGWNGLNPPRRPGDPTPE
ncbi:hypothetical protein [Cupriavidus pauculus]|uniref:hypothetical protein n=1 Tax=Cupriavidus pauculus TaxID=82633 RepID=UPI0011AFB5B2|nr:hypothetical protein [Cupriavidus pauculus]